MKKIIALTLALVLVLGLSTVAFAASKTAAIDVESTPLVYQSSGKVLRAATAADYVPGTVFYFWIENTDPNYSANSNITTLNALKDYRVGYSRNDGKNALDSVKLVTKDITTGINSIPTGKNAFIAVATKDTFSQDSIDLSLDIRVSALNSATVGTSGANNANFNFSVTLAYGVEMASDYTSIKATAPIVDFSDISTTDNIYLYFDNNVEFAVNAKNQGTLFLKYSDDAEGTVYANLEDKYPNALLDYHLFAGNRKTFRRDGILTLPASTISKDGKEVAPYLYEISSDGVLSVPRYSYNRDNERFEVKTKTLGNYVVSDTKLKVAKPEESSSAAASSSQSSTTGSTGGTGNAGNPDTGANDFVGLAVALVVVSFGAIAIAGMSKRKK